MCWRRWACSSAPGGTGTGAIGPRSIAPSPPKKCGSSRAIARREPATRERGSWRRMLVHRDVLLLAASYFCMNYVFYMFAQWLFTYLVEERGFSLLESGLLYVLPFATGAVLAAVGGLTCDALCRARRHLGLPHSRDDGLVLVAVFLLAGALRVEPVRRRRAAVAVLRLHAVHRRCVLVGDDLRRRPAHRRGHWRAEHGRQRRGIPGAGRGIHGGSSRLAADARQRLGLRAGRRGLWLLVRIEPGSGRRAEKEGT